MNSIKWFLTGLIFASIIVLGLYAAQTAKQLKGMVETQSTIQRAYDQLKELE